MVQLPVWELGLIIMVPMLLAFALRGMAESRYVETASPVLRSTMQFRIELGLFFGASMIMAFTLFVLYSFPLLQSGMKLVLGIVTVGLFAGLDLALARERMVIRAALSGPATYETPRELSPLTRKFSLVATLILLLITAIFMLVLIRDVHWLAEQDLSMASIDMLGRSVLLEIIFVMGFLLIMVINLVFSYAKNLRLLFENETVVLERVSVGDLTRKVPVATRDEMGVIAGHTNTMINALRDGVRMREGLLIAKEVQQHFLPESTPVIHGLDIAGVAHFSDETGGDFYDFIGCDHPGCHLTGVVVGDVSGHGVGAALLMAAGRALLRQSVGTHQPLSSTIAAVNIQLAQDIGDTGRFMTLFFMVLDPATNRATWVNAGHQPPLHYDPSTDAFTELRGEDIPLGVVEEWQFHEHYMELPDPGQIVLMGTDGVWEAHNDEGKMFGNDRLQGVIRANAGKSAQHILDAVVDAVGAFTNRAHQEDDVTLVVIKGLPR